MDQKKLKKYIIVDISGKVTFYDQSLYNAVRSINKDSKVALLTPGNGLLSLLPNKFKKSNNIIKRLTKVVEGLLNYTYMCMYIQFLKPDILHFQWLPFMEVNGWEIQILKCLKRFSSNTIIILTIHNIYPHNISIEKKQAYNRRFRKACDLIDAFIVHTNISKEEVVREFSLIPSKVHICYHGVFKPEGFHYRKTNTNDRRLNILMFGSHSYYKGTDILVDAVSNLNEKQKSKIITYIVGQISSNYLTERSLIF